MGVTLYLGFNEESNEVGEHCGKSFFKEIIAGRNPEYFNLDNFLTDEEQKLLYPDYADYSSFEEMIKNCRHIDPLEIITIFRKVYNYLLKNKDKLPLIHFVGRDKLIQMGTSDEFKYKGRQSYLDGMHHDSFHRNDLSLVSWQNGEKIIEWIPVSTEINLEGNIFFVETFNKFDEYKEILEACIQTCEKAKKVNKKLHWTYSV